MTDHQFQYDVALSFAGENRDSARAIADFLTGRGVRVFYDELEQASLLGSDLALYFTSVFEVQSRFVVVIVSENYREKRWTQVEFHAILSRADTNDEAYLLPIRADDTILDGLRDTIGYLDLRTRTPAEIGAIICRKLGLATGAKRNRVASPWSPASEGVVQFNYSSHDGRYRIGDGEHVFETAWSKASNSSIHCYTDPESIRGLALAPRADRISDVTDGRRLDFTSRVRTPEIGRVVVIENANGFFCAVRIIGIKDDTRGDDRDELTFEYTILVNGGRDFSGTSTMLATTVADVAEYELSDLRDHIEAVFDGIVRAESLPDDMRNEDNITRAIIKYLRNVEPVMRYSALDSHAVVKFSIYKPPKHTEPFHGDIALIVDIARTVRAGGSRRHQGLAFIEAKLKMQKGLRFEFQPRQLNRLSRSKESGLHAYLLLYTDEPVPTNPYLVADGEASRLSVVPISLSYDIIQERARGTIPTLEMASFSSTFAYRWLQGYDLDSRPNRVEDALALGAGSLLHTAVGIGNTFELALKRVSEIQDLDIPGYTIDPCEANTHLLDEIRDASTLGFREPGYPSQL